MRKNIVAEFLSALLVLLFAYTAFSKVFGMEEFKGTLYNQPIPRWLAFALLWTLPFMEAFAAGCLLMEKTRKLGLWLSLALLTLFTGYISAILLHLFKRIPCSCGGVLRHLSWQQHFWFNMLFLFIATLTLRIESKKSIFYH